MSGDIVIVGGSGVVGRRIGRHVAPLWPGRVVIAGRRLDVAQRTADTLGYGVRASSLDIDDRGSLERGLASAAVVMSCVDQPERPLLKAAAQRGLGYVDLAPHLTELRDLDALDGTAKRSGARLVLGAGISPGITSVMARTLHDELGGLDAVEVHLLFALGDEFGPSSSQFLFGTLSQRFTATVDGQPRSLQPFTAPKRVHFAAPIGERTTYLYPWSDPAFFPHSLGVKTALGRIAVDPPWVGALLSLLARSGLAARLGMRKSGGAQKRLLQAIKRSSAGRDEFAILVVGRRGQEERAMSLSGHRQADCTAAGAALVLRTVVENDVREAGAWLVEQVVEPQLFLERLAQHGLRARHSSDMAKASAR